MLMKYESKKVPGSFLVTDGVVDPKTKTVFVTIDGKDQTIGNATLKRWWRKIGPAEETEEAKKAEVPAEAPAESAQAEATAETEKTEDAPAEEPTEEDAEPEQKAPRVEEEKPYAEVAIYFEENAVKLNAGLFINSLPDISVEICTAPRSSRTVKATKIDGICRLSIGGKVLNEKSRLEIYADIVHALTHIYCEENNIVETCQKGRYHNHKFKEECTARGLDVKYDSANGWRWTSAGETFEDTLKTLNVDLTKVLPVIACQEPAKKRKTKEA